jgi:hypothetical protein
MKKLVLLLLCCGALTGHGFHSSLTSIDYVSRSHALQAVVMVNAGDLETLLRKESGRQIEIDRTADAAALIEAYVRKSVQVRAAGRDIPLRWVGMEVKTNFVYIYVEAEAQALDGLEIRNSLLMDLLPDQVNMLTLRRDGTGKPFDCLFQQGSGYAPVVLRGQN